MKSLRKHAHLILGAPRINLARLIRAWSYDGSTSLHACLVRQKPVVWSRFSELQAHFNQVWRKGSSQNNPTVTHASGYSFTVEELQQRYRVFSGDVGEILEFSNVNLSA